MIPPSIHLGGVRLRGLRPEDASAWHAYLSDPLVIELTSYPVMLLADVQSMIGRCLAGYDARSSCTWAIARAADDELIGTCGFRALRSADGCPELAYDLARAFWGRGIMRQAVRASLDWVFDTPEIRRVQAFVMAGNVRSERVLDSAGFTREELLPAYRVARGEPRDFWRFNLDREQWGDMRRRGQEML